MYFDSKEIDKYFNLKINNILDTDSKIILNQALNLAENNFDEIIFGLTYLFQIPYRPKVKLETKYQIYLPKGVEIDVDSTNLKFSHNLLNEDIIEDHVESVSKFGYLLKKIVDDEQNKKLLIQKLFDEKGDLYYSLRESGRSIRTCYLLSYAKENDSKFNIKDLYDLKDAESTKLLNNIHKIHEKIEESKEEKDSESKSALPEIRRISTKLMSDGMNSHTIEMSLFYSWLQLALSLRGKDPIIFEKNINNFQYKDEVVKIINNFDKTFNDTTSNKNMLELEDNVQKIKKILNQNKDNNIITQEERVKQVEKVNTTIFQSIGELLEQAQNGDIVPETIDPAILYMWYRTYNINNNESEKKFQKIERNWDLVYKDIQESLNNLV